MGNTHPDRDDVVCAALLVAWIAFALNAPAIASFLSAALQ